MCSRPGQVSSNLVSLLTPYNGVNGNIITNAITASTLNPPACTFTFLAPSLTGPAGVSQTVANGQYPTAVVILQPAFASISYPYLTGTVTVTDEASHTFTATLSGTGDTTFVPITNAPTGTHIYTANYSGDGVYPAISSFGNYAGYRYGGKPAEHKHRAERRSRLGGLRHAVHGHCYIVRQQAHRLDQLPRQRSYLRYGAAQFGIRELCLRSAAWKLQYRGALRRRQRQRRLQFRFVRRRGQRGANLYIPCRVPRLPELWVRL